MMELQVDLTQIILAILGIVASVVTAYVIPLLKSKLGKEKWEQFMKIVSVSVDAAEQLKLADQAVNKFEYAMQQIKLSMQKHGLTYDEATIKAAIESFVLQFNYSSVEYTADDLVKLKEAGIMALEEGVKDEGTNKGTTG